MQIGINLIKIKRKFNIGFPLRNRKERMIRPFVTNDHFPGS